MPVPRKPDPKLKPLRAGRRTNKAVELEPSRWFAGAWRSPQGIENWRTRARQKQRARRAAGTGR